MSTTYQKLLDRANQIYVLKRGIDPDALAYMAPEMVPKIESRQALSVLEAVAEELDYRESLDRLTSEQ